MAASVGVGVRSADHHHLGRSGESRGHAHHAGHLALRLGDEPVAGPGDDVDRLDRRCPVGHGGNGLGAADPEHLVYARDRGGGQRDVVHPAVGARWDAQDDLLHTGHLGGDGAHEHGRRIAGPPPGRVAAGPCHRPNQMADGDPSGFEVGDVPRGLVRVVRQDAIVGDVERVLEVLGDPGQRGLDLVGRHPKVLHRDPIELLGEAPECGVTMGAHVGDDVRHRLGGPVLLVHGTGQCVAKLAAATGEATEVQATESHSQTMLPDAGLHPARRRPTSGPARRDLAVWSGCPGAMIVGCPPTQQSCPRSLPPSTSCPDG